MDFYPVTIDEVIDETPLSRSFVFSPAEQDRDKFDYLAGQFVTFRIPWDEATIERCYSLSSTPGFDPRLKVTVKRVKFGKGSNWLNDQLKPGDQIKVSRPSGRFTNRDNSAPLKLYAGGSGITPVISIIRNALTSTQQDVTLFYANNDPSSVIFADELRKMEQKFSPRLYIKYHLDSESGHVTEAQLKDFAANSQDHMHFICGPGPFMQLVEDVLENIGINHTRVLIERFTSPDDPTSQKEAIKATAGIATVFRVRIDGEDHMVDCAGDQTLLEAMFAKGLDPLHQCKDGHCGSCMVICTSGEVSMAKTTALSKRDKNRGYILLCQARAVSDDIRVDCDI